MMRISIFLLAVLLLGTLLATMRGTVSEGSGNNSPSGSHRPELEYLKTVNSVAPPRDPQLLFLLMAQYANANMQGEGVEFFTARLKEFGPRLTDPQKALYLSAIGLLRAQHAPAVSLLHRVGYVKDTIAMLPLRASQLFSAEEGGAGGTRLVRGEHRQSAARRMVAGSLLPPRKAGPR